MNDNTNVFLEAALSYAEFGWKVVALHAKEKIPRHGSWPELASDDPKTIKGWWKDVPDGNVGIAQGSRSGLVAIDIDTEEGQKMLLEMANGDLPETLECTTGKGTRLLFSIPELIASDPHTVPIKGTDGKEALRLQGAGAQCVVPPSIHPGDPEKGIPPGRVYTWVEGRSPKDIEAASMPSWLIAEMTKPEQAKWVDPQVSGPSDSYPPGADFNVRGDWRSFLVEQGFKPCGGRGSVSYYTRPGKERGISVSVGHYQAKDGTPAMHVFSGSIPGLEADRTYDLFGVYTRLKHNGDFKASATDLSGQRLGEPRNKPGASSKRPGIRPKAIPAEDQGKPEELIITKLASLKARPIMWLVPGRIAFGKMTLFAGRGGLGKSTLTRSLAADVSMGRPAFGLQYPTEKYKVLFASSEDGAEDTILPSILAERGDVERIALLDGIRQGKSKKDFTLLPEHVELVRAKLLASPEIKLVIIDPIATYVGRARIDDHRSTELRLVLDPLNELAAITGAAIIPLAHMNKATGDAVDRIAGSAAYRDAVRAAFLVTEDPDDDTRRLLVPIKCNLPNFERKSLPFRLEPLSEEEADLIMKSPQFSEANATHRDEMKRQLARVRFEPVVMVDPNNAVGKKEEKSDPNKVDRCAEFVKKMLDMYAYPSDEIVSAAKVEGFTFDNVKRAKAKLKDEGLRNSNRNTHQGAWWSGFGHPNEWMLRPTPSEKATPHTPHSHHYHHSHHSPYSVDQTGETGDSGETSESGELFSQDDIPISNNDIPP